MTVEDCKKVIELIDKYTKWFHNDFSIEKGYNTPILDEEAIANLKIAVKGLIEF